MLMLRHRLQVLIDDDRLRRLEHEAERRSVAVAVVVRDAIDAAHPSDGRSRAEAADRILAAELMPVPDPDELRAELAELRERRA